MDDTFKEICDLSLLLLIINVLINQEQVQLRVPYFIIIICNSYHRHFGSVVAAVLESIQTRDMDLEIFLCMVTSINFEHNISNIIIVFQCVIMYV